MRLSIRLILFLVAGITIVTFIVSKYEVRSEKRGMRADLVRRAEILSESGAACGGGGLQQERRSSCGKF